MVRPPLLAALINPYTQWVHEYPQRLLALPTPELLASLRAQEPASCAASGAAPRLEVDLGCGSGNFLLGLAALRPQSHFVGFELRYKRLVKAARKLERGGLGNVWLMREEAEHFAKYFEPASVDRVYVNFPDPWPRWSQWKKRLVNPGFLGDLARVLKPQGRFCLKTDHAGYFLHVLAQVRDCPGWRILQHRNDLQRCSARPAEEYPAVQTEFEQMFCSQHKPIYFLALTPA